MKSRTHYACTDCGTTAPRWVGRCPGCGEWNTVVEEAAEQVRLRAERLAVLDPGVKVLAETVLPHIIEAARKLRPQLLVVDSVQTVYDPELDSAPGSVTQVREGAAQLVRLAKQEG